MSEGDAPTVFRVRVFGMAGRQFVVITYPCGVVLGREWERMRFPDRAFPVLDAGTTL